MLIFESDADYYYFYFFEGYGILFNTFAYIYDTNMIQILQKMKQFSMLTLLMIFSSVWMNILI